MQHLNEYVESHNFNKLLITPVKGQTFLLSVYMLFFSLKYVLQSLLRQNR